MTSSTRSSQAALTVKSSASKRVWYVTGMRRLLKPSFLMDTRKSRVTFGFPHAVSSLLLRSSELNPSKEFPRFHPLPYGQPDRFEVLPLPSQIQVQSLVLQNRVNRLTMFQETVQETSTTNQAAKKDHGAPKVQNVMAEPAQQVDQ